MTPPTTLDPTQLPGSYAERVEEAYRLLYHGEMEAAAVICRRIIDRINRLPARRRPFGSDLYDSLRSAAIALAEIYAKQGDWAALDEHCRSAQTSHPEHADRWAIEPFLLRIHNGQPQEGIDGMLALAESNPDSFNFWRVLAQQAWEVGNHDLALMASDHAAPLALPNEAADDMASHHLVRFQLFKARGEWQQAAHEWSLASRWDEEVEVTREEVVRMFLEAGLYNDALRYLEVNTLPTIVGDYYRGWIAQQRGDVVRARHLWRKTVEGEYPGTDHQDFVALRALAHCWLGHSDAALAILLEDVSRNGVLDEMTAFALALAWAIHGDVHAAEGNIRLTLARAGTALQPARRLSGLYWINFEQLVQDEAIKATLRPYFEPPRPPSA
jgi:tetratricopeptide (TPR) repeat protein